MINKGEFIKIDFTGKVKDDDAVFDTTDETLAKKENLLREGEKLGPKVVIVGEGHVISGLDIELEKHKIGDTFSVEVAPENGFGKKSAKLIQLIATSKFVKEGMTPRPGLPVNIDNTNGIVKAVSGGRTLVDFNHPLSGKVLVYDVKILASVEDVLEKVKEALNLMLGSAPEVSFKGEDKDTVVAKLTQAIPEPLQKALMERVITLTGIKNIEFLIGKA